MKVKEGTAYETRADDKPMAKNYCNLSTAFEETLHRRTNLCTIVDSTLPDCHWQFFDRDLSGPAFLNGYPLDEVLFN